MRCDEKHIAGVHIANNLLYTVIVALVCRLNSVPNRRLISSLSRKFALLIHIGTTDELNTEVIANKLRGSDFHWDNVSHALCVGLVAVHDNNLTSFVKFVGHLLTERLNAVLDKRLFSINI